jgi:GT2 family glycosyltransferase
VLLDQGEQTRPADLAVVVVSHDSIEWLGPCLSSVFSCAGDVELDVVVVENGGAGQTEGLIRKEFPEARVILCDNRGFGHANNVALRTIDASFVLFLNADTEIREGTLGTLVRLMEERPEIGLLGVKQITPDGQLWPTIRRFPNALRTFFEALGSERFPFRASWLGERELELARYDLDVPCDWTSGPFMLARREALETAGFMDERFFLYCEEPDLCLRIKRGGWTVRHSPRMTIVHHAGRSHWNPTMAAQEAYARRQYMEKNYSAPHLLAGIAATALGLGLRSVFGGPDRERNERRREANRAALAALLGRRPPPFGKPPRQAVTPAEAERDRSDRS